MSDTLLQAHDLSVQFGGVRAVHEVNFDVRHGEVFQTKNYVDGSTRYITLVLNAFSSEYGIASQVLKFLLLGTKISVFFVSVPRYLLSNAKGTCFTSTKVQTLTPEELR